MNSSSTEFVNSSSTFSYLDSKVTIFSPFFLFLIAGSCLSIFLLCMGFYMICKINRKQGLRNIELNMTRNKENTIQNEVKLKRSETEKEFQETKLRPSEKKRDKYSERENQNIDFCLRSQEGADESSFRKLYNHSFRTFGQKRRSSLHPPETRYYQHQLEYEENDSVHF